MIAAINLADVISPSAEKKAVTPQAYGVAMDELEMIALHRVESTHAADVLHPLKYSINIRSRSVPRSAQHLHRNDVRLQSSFEQL